MSKCYYYIKLPNGGEVRVPASSVIISNENKEMYEEIIYETDKHYTENKDFNGDSDLYKSLKSIGITLSFQTLKSIVNRSDKNTLIENINSEIENDSDTSDLLSSLRGNFLYKDKSLDYKGPKSKQYGKISLESFLEELNKPIQKNYLNGINVKGLINIQTPNNLILSINEKINDMKDIDVGHEGLNLLKRLITQTYWKDRANKTFFEVEFDNEVNDAVVYKNPETNEEIIFYNGLSDLSLFMGIFKSIASNINKEELINILNNYNTSLTKDSKNKINLTNFDVNEFFTGKFEDDNKGNTTFVDPEFNNMFKFKSSKPFINKIVDLMIPLISTGKGSKGIKNNIIKLLEFLDPLKFSKGVNKLDLELINTYGITSKLDKDLTNTLKSEEILPLIEKDSKDFYYSKGQASKVMTSFEDIYNYLLNNVTLEKDLLLVNKKGEDGKVIQLFIVPSEIKLTNQGILVRGYYNKDGVLTPVYNSYVNIDEWKPDKKVIKEKGQVWYRKFQSSSAIIYYNNADPISPSESIAIVLDKSELPEDLLKDAVVRGSQILYTTDDGKTISKTVKGVYPGTIKENSYLSKGKKVDPTLSIKGAITIITHKNIFDDEFTDSTWNEKLKILGDLKRIFVNNKYNPVEKNDYIMYQDKGNKYNKVLSVSDNLVYILINKSGKYYIKSINKNLIKEVYKKLEPYTLSEIEIIGNINEKIQKDYSIKEYNYSIIDNFERSANGDYILINNKEICKITNKDKGEVIWFKLNESGKFDYEYTVLKLNELKDYKIFTTRNIYSSSGVNNAELNNVFLTTDENINLVGNEELEEVKYIIPSEYSVSQLIRLNSGNLVKGKYLFGEKPIPSGFKDVTKELIKEINKGRGTTGNKLFIKKKGDYHVRYNAALYQSDFTINQELKKEYLKQGNYITFDKENLKSANKTYKIIGVTDDNLLLEYNTFNNEGKLITILKTFNLSNINNIKWIYALNGSDSAKKLKDIDNTKKLEERKKSNSQIITEKKELLNSLSKKFENVFEIPVEVENNKDFKNKKARILSDSNGKISKIMLNSYNINTNEPDLVHEYLHLFLIALKYNSNKDSINLYEKLLREFKSSIINQAINGNLSDEIRTTDNLNVLEEKFVEYISEMMVNEDFIKLENVDRDLFIESFKKSLKSLNINSDDIVPDIFGILNSDMVKIFPKGNEELSDSKLILFESNFREWMDEMVKNNKLIIECN